MQRRSTKSQMIWPPWRLAFRCVRKATDICWLVATRKPVNFCSSRWTTGARGQSDRAGSRRCSELPLVRPGAAAPRQAKEGRFVGGKGLGNEWTRGVNYVGDRRKVLRKVLGVDGGDEAGGGN